MNINEAQTIIKDFNDGIDRDKLLINKLRRIPLDSIEIAMVIEAMESTCRHCWNAESGCQCWNDE